MSSGEKDLAVNDIVLTREGNLRIVQFNVYVNGIIVEYISGRRCDHLYTDGKYRI